MTMLFGAASFLHSGCEVWRFTDDVDGFGRPFVRDMPNDNKACINAEAYAKSLRRRWCGDMG